MHAVKKIFEFVGKAVKWFFIVFLVYVASLFFRREKIPGEWVENAVRSSLPTNVVFSCESVSFGFRSGFKVMAPRLYDLTRKNASTPIFWADYVAIKPLSRVVRAAGVNFPRLQDSYYEEGGYAEPLGYGDWGFRFPKMPRFRLELLGPNILGAKPEFVRARVVCKPKCLSCSEMHLVWGGKGRQTELDGYCEVDLETRRVKGRVNGDATQERIRPLIDVLDLPLVLEYMDAFTEVEKPVPATCSWDVDLGSNEFTLGLDLHPTRGRYNGVEFDQADGEIGLHVSFPVRKGVRQMDYETTIGPLTVMDRLDRSLKGTLEVRGVGDVAHIHFNAESAMPLDNLLKIIDYLNDGELDCVVCETPPRVKVAGILATDVAHQMDNDLRGSFSFAKGKFFDLPVLETSSDFAYIGDKLYFSHVRANGKTGGLVTGSAVLSFPELDPDRATFSLDMTYANGSLAEVADFFDFDVGDKHGDVEGELAISGPIGTNVVEHLNGRGKINAKNGHLAQMKVFMGLTKMLAKEVPGVDTIVNQSEASCSFVIEDGVFKSNDILIEGSLFSISASGTYDIVKDNLDFIVTVQFLKNESILGKYLIRPVMWPFTKLLLEYKATGPLEDPEWDYISVLDRIL